MVEKQVAFLFSGQGAQFPGMAQDLWDKYEGVKELFTLASDLSSKDMTKLLFEGSEEELKQTENAQIAITLVNLSVREALIQEGINSQCSAGFSLGEFAAMVDANILSKADAFKLVVKRGEIMGSASASAIQKYGEVGMAAVIKLNYEQVCQVIASSSVEHVYAANNNSPAQVVISGTSQGIADLQAPLKEAGARRVLPLKVSGPFHTPLLNDGKEQLASFLEEISFADPCKDFYSNVTAQLVKTGPEVKELCIQQMVSPVQWLPTEIAMSQTGIQYTLECGPGSVLTGLWKKSGLEQASFACGTVEGINSAISALNER